MDYSNNESFERWRQSLTQDDLEKAQEAITTAKLKKIQEVKEKPVERSSSTRGPKPVVTPNPLYKHLTHALVGKLSIDNVPVAYWINDYVYGACYTVGGISSSGELNVSAKHVRNALMIPEISTASCQTQDLEARTAQRVAQAARYALSGIQRFLETNASVNELLTGAKAVEEMTCYDNSPQPYSESLDLYYAGEYERYAQARKLETMKGICEMNSIDMIACVVKDYDRGQVTKLKERIDAGANYNTEVKAMLDSIFNTYEWSECCDKATWEYALYPNAIERTIRKRYLDDGAFDIIELPNGFKTYDLLLSLAALYWGVVASHASSCLNGQFEQCVAWLEAGGILVDIPTIELDAA